MKHLQLKNSGFEHLEKAYAEWLDILGYAIVNISNNSSISREFFHHLEKVFGITAITQLEQHHLKSYYQHITTRGNQRSGGALSNNYINKHIYAIEKLMDFLHHKGVQNLPATGFKQLKLNTREVTVLSPEEIAQLYAVTEIEASTFKQEAISARDKAILAVYYGCGLRRNEGINLELNDINLDTRILHVRKGKNYKERFVPFGKTGAKHLEGYIYNYRPWFLKSGTESRVFIGMGGKPLLGHGVYVRIKILQQQVDNPVLQQKHLTVHNLRHSIATHLLAAGMELQRIQRFLGHSSLESTQIYTHLIKQAANG